MAKASISKMEKQWRAEEDARTLARYQEIMNDSKRKTAAMSQARQEAANLQKRADAMKQASGGRLRK